MATTVVAQEQLLVNFENREELDHIEQLSDGNYLLSGRTFELGNKSDLVIRLDENGNEIDRKVICPSCSFANVIYSKENSSNEVIHFMTNGDIYRSDLTLSQTEFVFNIKQDIYDSAEIYEVHENQDFVIVVSYGVQNGVRGLLHTVLNTKNMVVINNLFNTAFPDLSGSIGIGLFPDVGVVDGYNSEEQGVSTGHLLRYDIDRELLWTFDLDWASITLNNVLVSYDQNIYAVGSIVDPADPDHTQGLIVCLSKAGDLLWEKTFNASKSSDSSFDSAVRSFTLIEQVHANWFSITGYDGGEKNGEQLNKSYALQIDKDGEIREEFSFESITPNSEGVDIFWNKDVQPVLLSNAYGSSFKKPSTNQNFEFPALNDDNRPSFQIEFVLARPD